MALDIDRFAHLESPLQRWDPRLKLFSLGILIFAIALLKTIPLALTAFSLAIVLLALSRLPLHFVAQGVKWVALFLLPFFIIMPLTYPGESTAHLLGITFAWEGLRLATLIVFKALAIILIVYSVFGSSRFDVTMIALQRLKCPPLLVQMLLFTYRYIFVLLAEMKRMDIAMKARGFVKRGDLYTMRMLGGFIGTLIVRSFERTERIYKAMLSKGYQGELHTLVRFEAKPKDFFKAGVALVLAVIVLTGDLAGLFTIAEKGWF